MVGTIFGTILLVFVAGLSTLFMLSVLINFLIESREKKIQERLLHVVTADKWNSRYSGWSRW
jgi:hypothetical protein